MNKNFNLDVALLDVQEKIKNFVPNPESNELNNLFSDEVDEKFYKQYGIEEVEIWGASFSPSRILEKLDINLYNASRQSFSYNLTEEQKKEFPDYNDLLVEEKEIEKLIEEKENGE